MANWKEMYLTMFRESEKAMRILEAAQLECEEMYMRDGDAEAERAEREAEERDKMDDSELEERAGADERKADECADADECELNERDDRDECKPDGGGDAELSCEAKPE